VNHGLLVLRSKEFQAFRVAKLHDALTKTRNVSMAKDSPNPIDESVFATISFDELASHESNDGLSGG
jgi:hypothetical protein